MTFDDLKKLYWRRAHKGSTFPQYETPDHDAALRSVVAALRDEIEVMNSDENLHTTADVLELFDEILGGAGEKAAGVPTREDGPDVVISSVQTPAADLGPQDDGILIGNQNVEAIINDLHDEQKNKAAVLCESCPPVGYPTDKTRCTPYPRRSADPAVCEWRMVGKTFANAGCEDEYLWSHEYKVCPSCGKPISFREK